MTDLLHFLSVLALFLGTYTGAPALYLLLRKQTLSAERLWMASLLLVSLQAVLGTLWSLHPPAAPAFQLLLFAAAIPCAAELALRGKLQVFRREKLLPWILLLAIAVRAIDPILHPALGQSDAYGHLQFLRDIVTRGALRHPLYPPAHAWVSAIPALIGQLDLYTLARHGGAFYGLGLVSGVFFLTRRAAGSTAANHAALLAAAFPLLQPLLRSGIGLYANQLGLLLLPGILAAIPQTGSSRRLSTSALFLLPALALVLAVPMMFLDLAVVLCVNGLFSRFAPRTERSPILPILLGGLGIGALGAFFVLRMHPDQLNATVGLITASDVPVANGLEGLRRLLLDFLRPKSAALSRPLLLGTAAFALVQAGLSLWSQRRARILRPLFLLGAISGFQSVTGMLQFSSYQRAGWFFLIAACITGGWILRNLAAHFRLRRAALAGTALLCLPSLLLYPRHTPHLSTRENELIAHLRDLRLAQNLQSSPEPLTLWTRAFNDFPGAQGDPVPALLEDVPSITLRRVLPDDTFQFPESRRHLFLLEADIPPLHDNASPFEKNRAKLLSSTTRIRERIDPAFSATPHEGWIILEFDFRPGGP